MESAAPSPWPAALPAATEYLGPKPRLAMLGGGAAGGIERGVEHAQLARAQPQPQPQPGRGKEHGAEYDARAAAAAAVPYPYPYP